MSSGKQEGDLSRVKDKSVCRIKSDMSSSLPAGFLMLESKKPDEIKKNYTKNRVNAFMQCNRKVKF